MTEVSHVLLQSHKLFSPSPLMWHQGDSLSISMLAIGKKVVLHQKTTGTLLLAFPPTNPTLHCKLCQQLYCCSRFLLSSQWPAKGCWCSYAHHGGASLAPSILVGCMKLGYQGDSSGRLYMPYLGANTVFLHVTPGTRDKGGPWVNK